MRTKSLKDLGAGGAKISGIEFLSNNVFFQMELYYAFFLTFAVHELVYIIIYCYMIMFL
jgi:hypothetical protein